MERWYPKRIAAGTFESDRYARDAVDFLISSPLASRDKADIGIAEIGIWDGATTRHFAEFLENKGQLHLFDFHDAVASVGEKLRAVGYTNVTGHGSSYKYLDSYNWSFRNLLQQHSSPIFDYIYLDGAHTWAVDGFTFFLADLLLKPGGYIAFDDYGWTLRGSSMDPKRVPLTAEMYTDEQIDTKQVRDIVHLLVDRTERYRPAVRNKIFEKLR